MQKKKSISLVLVTLLLFSLFSGMGINKVDAAEIYDGVWEYSVINENEVEITAYNGSNTVVEIPETIGGKSVTSIGESAFADCMNLSNVLIPDSVTSIGNYAFYDCCNSLTNITIPNNVTYIGDYAFAECYHLTSITIPADVMSIGEGAFSGCIGLTTLKVDSSNQYYDSRDNCNAIIETSSNKIIAGCKNTVIPSSVTSIGDCAFYRCEGLTDITIPTSVTSIGFNAFMGSGLTRITIPSSVNKIVEGAFSSCSGLTSITVDSGNNIFDSRDNCNAIIETSSNKIIAGCNNTVIPANIAIIGEAAFEGYSEITSITIPTTVTSIEGFAFHRCTALTSIIIPNSVTSIMSAAFSECRGLTSITIQDGVKNIEDIYVFWGCENLKALYTKKGSYAEEWFKKNLPNVEIKYIGEQPPSQPTETPIESPAVQPTVQPAAQPTQAPAVTPVATVKEEAPAKVASNSIKNTKGKKLTAKWKKVSGAKGYEVQYSTNKKFKKAKTKTTKKTSLTIKNLKKKTYYVRIRAYTLDASGKKISGGWSTVKEVKIKK